MRQGRNGRTTGDVASKSREWSEWEARWVVLCWACGNVSVNCSHALDQRQSLSASAAVTMRCTEANMQVCCLLCAWVMSD